MNYGDPRLPAPFVEARQEYERITCAEADCPGCNFIHRRPFGPVTYWIDGERASEAAYREALERAKGLAV